MSYQYYSAGENILGIIGGLFSGIPASALSIAGYIMTALALYAVAKRRGIRKPWLAWIPVVNVWLIGSISDQYRYVVKGEIKSKRKLLLTLNILIAALVVAISSCAGVAIVMTVASGAYHAANTTGLIIAVCGLALTLLGVVIAYKILYFMALYDVYTSMDPENNTLFLVLSILFGVTESFFLFFNRNKDGGMPPRRETHSYTPPQEPWEAEHREYV